MAEETSEERLNRLICSPKSASLEDIDLTVNELIEARRRLAIALKANGRFYGLREAAGIIEAAMGKDVKVRFLAGKKEQASRAINTKLLGNVANVIRRYAEDQEAAPAQGAQALS